MLPPCLRPLIPNGCRRAHWHDYCSRCFYLITINKANWVAPFSTITGTLTDRDWPPVAQPTPLGSMIKQNITRIKEKYPQVSIMRQVVMPDHIHLVLFNTKDIGVHLSEIIRYFKSLCTHEYYNLPLNEHVGRPSIFESNYHDRILSRQDQLNRMLRYVSNNPRRRLERMAYSSFHTRHWLNDADGVLYEAYGNIQLLEDFDIQPVKVSSKYSPQELKRRKLSWYYTTLNGGVLVSPFISESERKVKNWAIDNGGRLILLLENGLGPRFHPSGKLHTLASEGRLLIIAPAEHSTAKIKLTRAHCQQLNALAEQIAAGGMLSAGKR